jgi:polyphenol oxidase
MFIFPKIFDRSKIIAVQSTRLGGVSAPPFQSLNLGLSVGDLAENVMQNRELFFNGLGIKLQRLAKSHQVHGNEIFVVEEPGNVEGYDALITNKKEIHLIVSIADCTPVLLHDEKNEAVAAIHAGWRGTVGKITEKAISEMNLNYGTEARDCKAYIGTCIGFENFEVGEEVAFHFENSVKRFDAAKNKWFVDLKSANKEQLITMGVLPENIEISPYCTVLNNDTFFSHRKGKGKTGRMMAVIGMK